jgi:hypothetical protein
LLHEGKNYIFSSLGHPLASMEAASPVSHDLDGSLRELRADEIQNSRDNQYR